MFADIDEARKALDRIDTRLFQAQTGQIQVTAELWETLEVQGDAIVEWLAEAFSSLTPKSKEEITADFKKIRTLNYMQLALERYLKFHPEPSPETNEQISRMFDPDNRMPEDEVEREWTRLFGFMFVERPQVRHKFLNRLLRR